MPAERRFSTGDRVMAKWPGSPLYFEGEVEDYNDVQYLVKFDDPDESKLAIKYNDVGVRHCKAEHCYINLRFVIFWMI